MRPKLVVQKLNGGLGRRSATDDMVTAVCMNAIAAGTMTLGTIYDFVNIGEVEALGINAKYDEDNSVLVYTRLKRLFDRNPSITLHCMFVAQTVTMAQMADKTNNYLAKILKAKAGKVVQAMICRNPATTYVPTITTAIDEDSLNAMYKLQELANSEFTKDRYCDFFVEGRSFSGASGTLISLRELVNKCPDVSMIIFADNDVSKKKAIYNGYAAVEDFVGMLSKAAVSQNAGELIAEFNLTDAANKYFLNTGLSSGAHIDTYGDEVLDVINDKGYIIAGFDEDGVYITDTHTCDSLDSDYAYVENNRTIKKAIKMARKAIKPRVKSRIYVDPDTGKIAPETAKDIEKDAKVSLRPMQTAGDLSGGIDAYVDPDQNILATSELVLLVTFVPVAIGRKITLKIGFKNPLNT